MMAIFYDPYKTLHNLYIHIFQHRQILGQTKRGNASPNVIFPSKLKLTILAYGKLLMKLLATYILNV